MKSKHEKRNQWLTFIGFVIFFIVAYKCAAQSPMKFLIPSKIKDSLSQVISVGICQEKGEYRLSTKYPPNKSYNLRIGFINGDIEYLPSLTYGEYKIPERVLEKLKTLEFEVLYFDGEYPLVCSRIKTKDYFIKNIPHE